jgi:hypothetical protein
MDGKSAPTDEILRPRKPLPEMVFHAIVMPPDTASGSACVSPVMLEHPICRTMDRAVAWPADIAFVAPGQSDPHQLTELVQMHSLCLVALPENAPLQEDGLHAFLEKWLDAYSLEREVEPYKDYDDPEWTLVQARRLGYSSVDAWGQYLKATSNAEEGIENGRHYEVCTFNRDGRFDRFRIEKIASLKAFKEWSPNLSTYSVVDKDGHWYSMEDYGYIPRLNAGANQPHPDNAEAARKWKLFLQAFFKKQADSAIFALLDVHS